MTDNKSGSLESEKTTLNEQHSASAGSDFRATSNSPSAPISSTSKSLLNSYLKSPQTVKPQRTVKELGNLQDLLQDSSTPPAPAATPSSAVKELGSLQQVLRGSTTMTDDPTKAPQETTSPYAKANLFARSSKSATSTTKGKNTSAFSSTDDTPTSPYKNVSILALGIFGIGACIFGINQLIKNANLNFASEDSTTQTPITPPRILTFQGRLSDFDQNSITQPKAMRFTLYNTSGGNTPPPIGGEILWDSNLCQVTPNQSGIFTVNLGAGSGQGRDDFNCGATLGNIFSENSNVWLQITVENEILFPRQLIKSVPYALNSETLQGFPASQSATANTVPVVDSNGNLNFGTANTSIINLGALNLVSKTGDIYLLPGAGTVYIGDASAPANLHVTGNATVSGSLDLSQSKNPTIIIGDQGVQFKSQAGQDEWETQMSLSRSGFLGLGTNSPTQKLTINKGSLGFDFANGPILGNLKLSEDATDLNALRRIDSPTQQLSFQTHDQGNSTIQAGEYKYAYSYVTATGTQTALSPIGTYNLDSDNKSILLTNLQTSGHAGVVARNIYRTKRGGNDFYLLKTISDNSSTSTFDNLNDSNLAESVNNLSTTGNYRYRITFVTNEGETNPSAASNPIKITGDGRVVKVENIPLASQDSSVTARKVYRTVADSDQYYLVATLTDNSTTTIYDNIGDSALTGKDQLHASGGIYVNNRLSLQFNTDGSLVTNGTLTADGRVETTHGDNQGLKLPTSVGKPFAKVGQQIGDIVFDSVGQVLYIYNGIDFVATGLNNSNSTSLANSSNCTGNICRLVLEPEYAGAVVTGDGSDNNGTFTSGTEILANNYLLNYYQWVSADPAVLNDFDTTINFSIPGNFTSWQDSALTLDLLTQSASPADNNVQLEVFKGGNIISVNKTDQVSAIANQWMSYANSQAPIIITAAELNTLGFTPNDTLTLKIKTSSKNNNQVRIGQINLNYLTDEGVASNGSQSVWKQVAGVIFPTTTSDVVLGGDSTASARIGFLNLAGTGTPTLYVKGNIFLDNASKNNYLDLATESSFNIRTTNPDNSLTERFTILPNGNIGIGTTNPTEKLEVAGNVKIDGSLQLTPMSLAQAGPCDSANEGKIYYDVDQSKFFACQAQDTAHAVFAWIPLN